MTRRRNARYRDAAGWARYLHRFHDAKAGITESLLRRARAGGVDPFTWCAELLHSEGKGVVVDLACGSGPMATALPAPTGASVPVCAGSERVRWIGVDLSVAELGVAAVAGRGPLVRGSATRLPFLDRSASAVVCSMGLQIIEPVEEALAEMARVLEPGGSVVLLLPASGPIVWRDALAYLRLQLALRRVIAYPNSRELATRRLPDLAGRCSLQVTHDEARAFALPIRSGADVAELVESLYLPGLDHSRRVAARAVLGSHIGRTLTIPLRRVGLSSMVAG